MFVDWTDPVVLLFAHLLALTALEALGGLFVFRPAVDGLRLRLSRRQSDVSWRATLATGLVTALLAFAYYLWMPGDLDALTAKLSTDEANPFEEVDGLFSRIGLPGFLLLVSSIVILSYWALIFGFVNPILRAIFDALYFPLQWGLNRFLPSEGGAETELLAARISEAKKILSGLLVLLLGVVPGLGFLLPGMNDMERSAALVPHPAKEELELFLGFTKNELIRFSEATVLGLFIFAFLVTIAVPLARHVLATIPDPGFNRREIRRVGYWLVTVWIVVLAIYGTNLYALVFPLVAIPVLLWFARPLLEWLRFLINGRERSDLLLRTILLILSILLLFYGYAALGLKEITAATGSDAGADVSASPILDNLIGFLSHPKMLDGLVPICFLVGVVNPLLRLLFDIVNRRGPQNDQLTRKCESSGLSENRRMIAVGLVIVFSILPGGLYVAESQGYWKFDVIETVPIRSPEGEPTAERPLTAFEKRKVTFIKKTEIVYLNLILLATVLVPILPLTRHVMISVRGVGFSLYTIHVTQATVVVVWLGAVTISAVTGWIGSP